MLFKSKPSRPDNWRAYAGPLRDKWHEVPSPVGRQRVSTTDLLRMNDDQLRETWELYRTSEDFEAREWYRFLYAPIFRGKKILDLGCGLGFDTTTFARNAAEVICSDIVKSNIDLVSRVVKIFGIPGVHFFYIDDPPRLNDLPGEVDVVWCAGSFHHAPSSILREEARIILNHLPVGGRWIELAYPRTRWMREGRRTFDEWGRKTDGGAPWTEWYDIVKLKALLAPAEFKTVMNFEFHHGDFVWFDLVRVA